MTKPYRPSVRYDARYKDYVDRIKECTGLDGAQIIRLALFVSASNPQFISKLKEYADDDFKMPMPRWSKSDDNMWLSQQGETTQTIQHNVVGVASNTLIRPNSGGIVIKIE